MLNIKKNGMILAVSSPCYGFLALARAKFVNSSYIPRINYNKYNHQYEMIVDLQKQEKTL